MSAGEAVSEWENTCDEWENTFCEWENMKRTGLSGESKLSETGMLEVGSHVKKRQYHEARVDKTSPSKTGSYVQRPRTRWKHLPASSYQKKGLVS